jgi:hypothetical protein
MTKAKTRLDNKLLKLKSLWTTLILTFCQLTTLEKEGMGVKTLYK